MSCNGDLTLNHWLICFGLGAFELVWHQVVACIPATRLPKGLAVSFSILVRIEKHIILIFHDLGCPRRRPRINKSVLSDFVFFID
jgi:hypothetical protein